MFVPSMVRRGPGLTRAQGSSRVHLPPSTLPLAVGAPGEASPMPDPGPWEHVGSTAGKILHG